MKEKWKIYWVKYRAYVLTVIITALICNDVIAFYNIKSASMEPTLMTGDVVIYNRLAYVTGTPARGDIIAFRREGNTWGKRVIGIAGDVVSFADGDVYVNGSRLDESAYLDASVRTYCNRTFTVPDNCIFVLGDNRMISNDSRFWDKPFVSCDDVVAGYLCTVPIP